MLDKNEEKADKKETTKNNLESKKEIKKVEVNEAETDTENIIETSDEDKTDTVVAKKQKPKEEKEISTEDYSKKNLEELLVSLKELLANHPVQKIKTQIEAIKNEFNKKFGTLLAEKKAAFLADGGNSIDFHFSSPIKTEYNALLAEYKKQRDAFYKELNSQLDLNLAKRNQVIESLKALIDDADAKTMYKDFQEIQNKWKVIGPVPKSHYNDTWKIYHHHVERFYDLLNLSNDLRDIDFKYNLEEKLKIIERAKALANEPDVNLASKKLQELHKSWKEDIGPVAKEMREEIWQKFSEATKKIHDRRHNYFKEMRSKFQEIIDEKLKVIALIQAYDTSGNKTHSDWQKSISEIEKLRQKYFKAGKLPYNKSEEVWQKFKTATKKFNSAKNKFYKQEKNEQQENLKKKIELIELAESLKDSEDWQMATNTMKRVQADWKKIGHVPRKFSDDIWKRFKAACNYYFDRLHKQKNKISKEKEEIVEAKKEFLDTLKETKKASKDTVLEAIDNWRELGSLPKTARNLKNKFNKQVDKMFEDLSLDKEEVEMLKFTSLVDSYVADNDIRKLESEQQFVRKRIDEMNKEIQQLENNLGFFSNTKGDNPLVQNVKNKVSGFKKELLIWKEKLNYLKKLNY